MKHHNKSKGNSGKSNSGKSNPGKGSSVAYHNRVAKRYDAIYSDDEPYWRFHDEATWRAVKNYLPRDLKSKCLDLGCGTGKWGLKLRKSGFDTTFVDHSPAMIAVVKQKLEESEAPLAIVADIIQMPMLADQAFALTLAMGDPLSICTDPQRAADEMFRTIAPGGVVIATADNRAAAMDHFINSSDLDGLERLLRTRRTNWLTRDENEQFETTTFTPDELRDLFRRSGFEVLRVMGKTILPVRSIRESLSDPATFRRLIDIEVELEKHDDLAARASHLQIIARRPLQTAVQTAVQKPAT